MIKINGMKRRMILMIMSVLFIVCSWQFYSCEKESVRDFTPSNTPKPNVCEGCAPAVGIYNLKYILDWNGSLHAVPFESNDYHYRAGYLELDSTGIFKMYLNESYYNYHQDKWEYLSGKEEYSYYLKCDSIIVVNQAERKCYPRYINEEEFIIDRIDLGILQWGSYVKVYIRD